MAFAASGEQHQSPLCFSSCIRNVIKPITDVLLVPAPLSANVAVTDFSATVAFVLCFAKSTIGRSPSSRTGGK